MKEIRQDLKKYGIREEDTENISVQKETCGGEGSVRIGTKGNHRCYQKNNVQERARELRNTDEGEKALRT